MRLLFALPLISVALLPYSVFSADKPTTHAHQLYKYTDEQNVTVISTSLPPEAANKGYTILNSQGYEKEIVPPPLSNQAFDAATQQEHQKKENEDLLTLFDTVEDIQEYKKNQIMAIENIENITLENIKRLQAQIEHLQTLISSYQDKKQPVPSKLTQEITKNEQLLNENKSYLKRKTAEKQAILEHYDQIVKRFQSIKTNYKPTTAPGVQHD